MKCLMAQPGALREVLSGKQLLIFDFDGTIADTSPLHTRAFAETLAPLGVTVDYSKIAGRTTDDAMRLCFAAAGKDVPDGDAITALTIAKQNRVREMIAAAVSPLPGVDDFLRWAKRRYRMALVTSGSRGTVELALQKLGYSGWFDPILFAEDIQRAKPDPEGFLLALKMTGVSPKGALVFEDSEAGFQAAENAGIAYVDVQIGVPGVY